MRAALVAAVWTLLVGCTFADVQVRKRAAMDFGCPEDDIVVHHVSYGYLARGCRKEADYVVQDGQATRNSEIRKAAFDERVPVPIDHIAETNSVGIK